MTPSAYDYYAFQQAILFDHYRRQIIFESPNPPPTMPSVSNNSGNLPTRLSVSIANYYDKPQQAVKIIKCL